MMESYWLGFMAGIMFVFPAFFLGRMTILRQNIKMLKELDEE